MDKYQIAEILNEIGVLLEIKGENRFKCLAYYNAARALELLQEDLAILINNDRLGEVKGVGASLCEKITELFKTGKLAYYEELKASIPAGLFDCMKVPGLGPKKVKVLYEKLGINSLGDLKLSCERGMIAKLDGFGEKTQQKILEGIANLAKYRGQYLYVEALNAALPVYEVLKKSPDVQLIEMAGSLRRKKEVIRDVDFVVATSNPEKVMSLFVSLPQAEKIVNQGKTKSTVMLKEGIQADVRCVSKKEFPFALTYFTGSKEHNIVLRQRAIDRGKKLNEYGLFDLKGAKEILVPCKDEAALYQSLGLSYIEPELREDMGEIAASDNEKLPKLLIESEIHGTFHCHTQWSDGANTLEEMARAAIARGWEYLGIADHSKSSAVANGLTDKRLAAQIKEIQNLNQRFRDEGHKFRLFSGSEVDILADGSLDFSDEVLASLDYVVVSIHQGFSGDQAKQTERVIRAISNRYATMLGHATGRLLLSRESIKLDLNAVIAAAAGNHTIIELNSTPQRMELDWRWWPLAKQKGVKCAINPDAHSTAELAQVDLGVKVARKGWLEATDVINTQSLGQVEKTLKQKRN